MGGSRPWRSNFSSVHRKLRSRTDATADLCFHRQPLRYLALSGEVRTAVYLGRPTVDTAPVNGRRADGGDGVGIARCSRVRLTTQATLRVSSRIGKIGGACEPGPPGGGVIPALCANFRTEQTSPRWTLPGYSCGFELGPLQGGTAEGAGRASSCGPPGPGPGSPAPRSEPQHESVRTLDKANSFISPVSSTLYGYICKAASEGNGCLSYLG